MLSLFGTIHYSSDKSSQTHTLVFAFDPEYIKSLLYGDERTCAVDAPIKEDPFFVRNIGPFDSTASSFFDSVNAGLRVYPPELIEEGVNGSYFLKNPSGQIIGIFKPEDEEGSLSNNPKKLEEPVCPKGVVLGEGASKEVATYLLDSEGFYNVPKTFLVQLKHPMFPIVKRGSVQEFVANVGSTNDFGPSYYSASEVHKIGLLDLQIMNLDRHGGNILLSESDDGSYKLIPIDNGFCLPETLENLDVNFEWMNWRSSKQPFDETTKQHVASIDVEKNIQFLAAKLNVREECLNTMKITATLLKKGVAKGLTLHEIGKLVCPSAPNQPSPLGLWIGKAKLVAQEYTPKFYTALFSLMDAEMNKN